MAAYVSNVAHGTLVLILHPPPPIRKTDHSRLLLISLSYNRVLEFLVRLPLM